MSYDEKIIALLVVGEPSEYQGQEFYQIHLYDIDKREFTKFFYIGAYQSQFPNLQQQVPAQGFQNIWLSRDASVVFLGSEGIVGDFQTQSGSEVGFYAVDLVSQRMRELSKIPIDWESKQLVSNGLLIENEHNFAGLFEFGRTSIYDLTDGQELYRSFGEIYQEHHAAYDPLSQKVTEINYVEKNEEKILEVVVKTPEFCAKEISSAAFNTASPSILKRYGLIDGYGYSYSRDTKKFSVFKRPSDFDVVGEFIDSASEIKLNTDRSIAAIIDEDENKLCLLKYPGDSCFGIYEDVSGKNILFSDNGSYMGYKSRDEFVLVDISKNADSSKSQVRVGSAKGKPIHIEKSGKYVVFSVDTDSDESVIKLGYPDGDWREIYSGNVEKVRFSENGSYMVVYGNRTATAVNMRQYSSKIKSIFDFSYRKSTFNLNHPIFEIAISNSGLDVFTYFEGDRPFAGQASHWKLPTYFERKSGPRKIAQTVVQDVGYAARDMIGMTVNGNETIEFSFYDRKMGFGSYNWDVNQFKKYYCDYTSNFIGWQDQELVSDSCRTGFAANLSKYF